MASMLPRQPLCRTAPQISPEGLEQRNREPRGRCQRDAGVHEDNQDDRIPSSLLQENPATSQCRVISGI